MNNWTMIEKKTGFTGRKSRTTPAVSKPKRGTCVLLVPDTTTTFKRANIYTDGNGKLAFHFCDGGKYSVNRCSKVSKQLQITIPSAFTARIPSGTTDARLTRDGDFYVLDLSQFAAAVITAAA